MNKKYITLTFVNYLICLSIIIWIFFSKVARDAQAYQNPATFLGPIYYGEETILKVFDHKLPLFQPNDDGNSDTMHYDGTLYPQGSDPYYGYDQHTGVDYNLKYEPVLAAADGYVEFAGWSDPADHQKLYGLHVRVIPTANISYKIWHGHLSVTTIETGDTVMVYPTKREGIIGISGNTGSVLGGCPPVYINPLCGSHLHLEVRFNGKPVNPYGWVGSFTDPWSVYIPPTVTTMPGTPTPTPATNPTPSGATSYDLWATYPARPASPAQYPDGPTIIEPTLQAAVRTIDNSDPEFSYSPSNCMAERNDEGVNGSFYYTLTTSNGGGFTPICIAKWQITPNSLTPAGNYDLYVYIPGTLYPAALDAEYEIYYNGGGLNHTTAIVVQAAYPNGEHPSHWVYMGRYYFTMSGDGNEFVRMNNLTIADDSAHWIAADAIQLARAGGPAVTATPTNPATFTPTPTPQATAQVTLSSDDAGHKASGAAACTTATPSYATNHEEIYAGHCSDGANVVSGFRFTNLAIPPGAVITKAQIEFTADGPYDIDDTINVQFRGELIANSSTFDNTIRPDNRNLTQATVLWNASENWTIYQRINSPNLKSIIQEIINLTGWQSGNALTIIVQPQIGMPDTTHRRVFAIDREYGLHPAKLHIWYTTPYNTGFKSPTANVADSGNGDGNGYESNPNNVYSNNGVFAGDYNSGTSSSAGCTGPDKDSHRFYNFSGFTIPSNATITGIEVRLDAKADSVANSPHLCVFLSRDGGATWTLFPKETPTLGTSEGIYYLGGPTDLWGSLWLPSDFSSSNFRIRVVDAASSISRDFFLDWVAVKVYYVY